MMTRADLEAAAEEKYPVPHPLTLGLRAAYVQGRLDQAEADARTAEVSSRRWHPETGRYGSAAASIAAAIREGVE